MTEPSLRCDFGSRAGRGFLSASRLTLAERKIWNRDTTAIRTVKTFSDEFICYDVVMADGIIAYSGSKKFTPSRPLVILDSQTGHEIRRISAQFNGRIIPLDSRTVVCELGY